MKYIFILLFITALMSTISIVFYNLGSDFGSFAFGLAAFLSCGWAVFATLMSRAGN
jgi:hypothetical protein